ncbi:hypothetical protein BIV23_38635 [Streptomyces monashensis]|uniref:Uncharacterized protein n=1 Tax=Streptomyces monashensis TaxID=1678012 RepID=A0A1S2PH15_9ACTN|nr:hypothetical protein BIV23_38635 [Streptomyces monashensis]
MPSIAGMLPCLDSDGGSQWPSEATARCMSCREPVGQRAHAESFRSRAKASVVRLWVGAMGCR